MGSVLILLVTAALACVQATIEWSAALQRAPEGSFEPGTRLAALAALQLAMVERRQNVLTPLARDILDSLAAVASGCDQKLATPAETIMTWPGTGVFAAR